MGDERIFIGLWPDAQACRALQNLQSSLAFAARAVPPDNLHLTLAFIGSCDSQRQDCVLQAATLLKEQPFDLELDQLGYFPRPRLFYLSPSAPPQALLSLHKQLCRALSPCRFKAPRIYKPHITLFRGMQTPPYSVVLPQPIQWRVHSLHVARSELSEKGARYTSIKEHYF